MFQAILPVMIEQSLWLIIENKSIYFYIFLCFRFFLENYIALTKVVILYFCVRRKTAS